MVNSDVDDYTKTLNHRKIVQKTNRNNLLKTKTILKPKHQRSGVPVFTCSFPKGDPPLYPPSVMPLILACQRMELLASSCVDRIRDK